MRKLQVLFAFGFALLINSASAVTLYGVTSTQQLVKFDTINPSAVEVVAPLTNLPPTANQCAFGLTWDPGTPDTLYALCHRTGFGPYWLIKIDISTGVTDPVFIQQGQGMSGLEYVDNADVTGLVIAQSNNHTNQETVLYHVGSNGSLSLLVQTNIDNNQMAWDSQNDVLHSQGLPAPFWGQTPAFYAIDLSDGSDSNLGAYKAGQMAYSLVDDSLYQVEFSTNDLWRIDTTEGGVPIEYSFLGTVAGDAIWGLAAVAPAVFVSLKSLGDITGDSRQDSAVVEQTDVTVKKLNSSTINTFQFSTALRPVGVEVMQDINNNGATELVLLAEGSTKTEVRDSLTGEFLGAATFSPDYMPIDLAIVPDQNGNQIPELAVLQKKAGSTRVEIRDALSGSWIKAVYFNPNFNPKDLVVLPNVGGTGALDLAVLQDSTDPQIYNRVEIRDMESKQLLRNVWFGQNFEVKQLEVLEDVNNNGTPELAVLKGGGVVNVLVRDAGTGKYIRNIGFDPNFTPQKLLVVPDTDNDGEQELGLMSRRPDNGQVKIELRDVTGGELTKNIWYGVKDQPLDAAVYPDINGNGSAELGVLGRIINNPDQLILRIKDARTNEFLNAILF
ncbi:MAG: hypothetical protein ACN4GR_07810 [Arenicellales bacterium]